MAFECVLANAAGKRHKWRIEQERPLALGHFADSLVPLHR